RSRPGRRAARGSSLVLLRGGLDLDRFALAGAEQLQVELGLAPRGLHVGAELPAVADRLAAELHEDVVLLDARLLRDRPRLHLGDEDALVLLQGKLVAQGLADGVHADAELAASGDGL